MISGLYCKNFKTKRRAISSSFCLLGRLVDEVRTELLKAEVYIPIVVL